tara:strand:+ start:219 stop:641 length:423 start_codon:yes stop_codon:yes gene_type:complete
MSIKHKIILNYIKDLSVETPDPESLIVARERISKYGLNLDITSKPLKNKMIEVFTKLIYADKEKSKKKTYFEMLHSTVVQIEDENPEKEEMKKFILCDLQIEIYPKIQETFIQVLKLSGFPQINISGKVDFVKLYKERSN